MWAASARVEILLLLKVAGRDHFEGAVFGELAKFGGEVFDESFA